MQFSTLRARRPHRRSPPVKLALTLAALACCLWPGALLAHDFWIIPNAFVVFGAGRQEGNVVLPMPTAPNDSASAAATVIAYRRALASGDSALALALLAPDAVILEAGGMETREEYRSHHLASDIEFARAVRAVDGPLQVTVRGDVAWVVSTSVAQGQFRGRAVNSVGAESMVLTRIDGEWKIAVIHWSSRARRQ